MHATAFPVTDLSTVYELPPRFRLLHVLAVRLALASPPLETLREALQTLARMLNAREEEFDFTE